MERYFKTVKGRANARFMTAKKRGLLDKKIKQAQQVFENCELCEHRCQKNRKGELGFCGVSDARIFGAHTHWGEERELVPSATLFFSGCTMRCCYCQNAPQSISAAGEIWSADKAAKWIEQKHREGCRNVNFVGGDPTPNILFILNVLKKVRVNIPVVFNSNAYYSLSAAELLKDVIDVYLLDFRYFDAGCAEHLSKIKNYPETAKRNILLAEKNGELLIRLLVLPGHIECDAKPIIAWISENLKNYRLNIMPQYTPAFHAYEFPEIGRKLSIAEYNDVIEYAKGIGIES
ncbi:MAG: radical SAM protein [Candidatus Aenigmarchaeota archaeon]|nr:radical SAM protein [Candidatus Aenigmarchaeota archaeon]